MTYPATTEPQDADQGAGTVDNSVEVAPSPDTANQPEAESAPPWQGFVEKFPEAFRGVAEEAAREWDAGVTKRFTELHSTYEPYKPYIEQWDPEAIGTALSIAQQLEENPQEFLQALMQHYGPETTEQGPGTAEQAPEGPQFNDEDFDPSNPLVQRLQHQEQLLQTVADFLISQQQAETEATEQAEQDAWLDQTLTSLKETHGEFDEEYVINAIAAGVEPEDAVKKFQDTLKTWAARQNAPQATAPRVMSGGGGIPSVHRDPATLTSKETRNLIVELLRSGEA